MRLIQIGRNKSITFLATGVAGGEHVFLRSDGEAPRRIEVADEAFLTSLLEAGYCILSMTAKVMKNSPSHLCDAGQFTGVGISAAS